MCVWESSLWNVKIRPPLIRLALVVLYCPDPESIDPVFAKTSQNARFLLRENERFGLVFVKTGSINSGTGEYRMEGGQEGIKC